MTSQYASCVRCGIRRQVHVRTGRQVPRLCMECYRSRRAAEPTSSPAAVRPACEAQPELFASTLWTDHVIARESCLACPLLANGWCRSEYDKARRLATDRDERHGPTGTWFGTLIGQTSRVAS